jgi:hypothetical protein
MGVISPFVRSYSFFVRGDSCPGFCWACSSRPSFFQVDRDASCPPGVTSDEVRKPVALVRVESQPGCCTGLAHVWPRLFQVIGVGPIRARQPRVRHPTRVDFPVRFCQSRCRRASVDWSYGGCPEGTVSRCPWLSGKRPILAQPGPATQKPGALQRPKLAIGDGSFGFWALQEEYGQIAQQGCWVRRTANSWIRCLRASRATPSI